jgi:UDP-N-acetylglucosamine--N-acetylmuramyl-(pentapeptide) pyrophosphoryl-undecaprenol N-acetylglucosamine transferase
MGRTLVIAGGGTGGHVFPGLAVAAELRRRDPKRRLRWIGARGGLEATLVPRAGLPLSLLPMGGLLGRGPLQKLSALILAALAYLRCLASFLVHRPALAVGVGGYASGPALLAAATLRVPTLLLEQNAVPGSTNRWLSRVARVAAITFPETAEALACRAEVTGNPVRAELAAVPERRPGPVRHVLVFGGSRGAHQINLAAARAAPAIAETGLHLVHQTGEEDFALVESAYREAKVPGEVRAFLHDMAERYATADLVVCRAGATTVAELTAVGRAALLVPFPHATADHQRANASRLAEAGAAAVLDPDELGPESLVASLRRLADDPERVDAMGRRARALGHADAAGRIADLAEELLEGGR